MKRLFLFSFMAVGLSSLTAAAPLYPECPAVGANNGCAVLITINADNSTTLAIDSSQGPYDGSEDSLVGVLNNSATAVGSLPLTGSDIFGFDADGMCSSNYGAAGNCSKGLNQGDPYDYAGDFVTFTVTDNDNGVVNFIGGLSSGKSTYFSLEEAPTLGIVVGPPSPSSPEPATFGLMIGGGCLFYGLARRRRTARP